MGLRLWPIFIIATVIFASKNVLAEDVSTSTSAFETRLSALEKQIYAKVEPDFELARPHLSKTELGPTASKIYFTRKTYVPGLSADFLSFSERRGLSGTDKNVNRINVNSLSPSLGIRFHRRVLFNSQLYIENGGAESSNTVTLQKGQVIVLMAYADWFSSEREDSGLRIGHQLVPFGRINTRQESLTYFGVLKPELSREIIPALWHENGLSYYIDRPTAHVQFGIFNSFDAKGFRGSTFLSGGRNGGQYAPAEDFMGVVRVEAKPHFFRMGASFAAGPTAQGNPSYLRGTFRLGEAHIGFERPRLHANAQWVQGDLGDTEAISVVNSSVLGSRARGHSFELALSPVAHGFPLWIFARRSHYDLHDQVSASLNRDNSYNKTATTIGADYRPMENWAFKMDYAFLKSAASDSDDEVNFATTVSF